MEMKSEHKERLAILQKFIEKNMDLFKTFCLTKTQDKKAASKIYEIVARLPGTSCHVFFNDMQKRQFIKKDESNMVAFLGYLLDYYKEEGISKEKAISALSEVIKASNNGDYYKAVEWFEQGRKLLKRED